MMAFWLEVEATVPKSPVNDVCYEHCSLRTTAHAAQLVAGDADERFRFAIDVVIDGVLGRATRR
jgi:hypothetical protein